jgi:hypothetical protein
MYNLKNKGEAMKKVLWILIIPLLGMPATYGLTPLQPVTLTIHSYKPVYEAGEEIRLRATFENRSPKEQIVFLEDRNRAVVMSDEAGVFYAQIPWPQGTAKPVYIKSKTVITKDVFFELTNFAGTARVNVQYSFRGNLVFKHKPQQEICLGSVSSDFITFEVKQGDLHGPASIQASKAMGIAERFITEQPFKDSYEPQASSVIEHQDYVDVYFKTKVPSRPPQGVIRVDKKNWQAKWMPQD